MRLLRKPVILGLIWFFCLGIKQGRADVETYKEISNDTSGTPYSGECVAYVEANRQDLIGTTYSYAKNMPSITSGVGFTVDANPETGSAIVLANMQVPIIDPVTHQVAGYTTEGHTAVVTKVTSPWSSGNQTSNYILQIKDANFDNRGGTTPLIGEANYTYNPNTLTVTYIDYAAYGGSQSKKYDTTTSRNPAQFQEIWFIHENQTVLNAFTQHNIPPTAEQLEALSQGLLQGNGISWLNSRFDSDLIKNNYVAFPNYGQGKYLVSGAGGQKEYKILLKKFEISTDGSNWVTVGEGDVWLDLASTAANSTILANYASNAHIPPGTYRYYRLTHGTYYTIKGYVTDPISRVTYYTTSNFYQSSQPGDNSRDGISSTSAGEYGECVMKVNSYSNDPGFAALNGGDSFSWAQPFAQPFQITAGTRKITLTFNMGTGIAFIPNGWVNNGHVNFDTGGTPIIPVVTVQ